MEFSNPLEQNKQCNDEVGLGYILHGESLNSSSPKFSYRVKLQSSVFFSFCFNQVGVMKTFVKMFVFEFLPLFSKIIF